MEVITLLSRGLTRFDPAWRIAPDLAATMPVPVVDPTGGTTVRFAIRADAAWEDGAPVVGADFVAGWRRALDATSGVVESDAARKATLTIDPADAKVLQVRFAAPYPTWNDARLFEAIPAHAPQRDLARQPLSNGPFRLTAWTPGQHATLSRNERYAPRPRIDEIVVRFFASTTTLAAAMLAGEVDVAPATGGLTTGEAARLVDTGRFQTSTAKSGSWAHVDFNLDDPWLRDARLRRALAASIDRTGAVQGVFGPAYTIADSFLPPVHPLFSPEAKAQGFDPVLAARLFDEAGWTRAADGATRSDEGVRKNAAGEELHLVLASASGQADAEKLLVVLQSQWRKAGVSVELDLRPFASFFQEGVKKRGFKHLAFYAWTMGPTTTGDTMWRADRVPAKDNAFAGKNIPGWRDDAVTKLLIDAEATVDEAERRRLLAVVQRRFVDELPSIPMYFKPSIAVFRTGVSGVQPTGTTTPTTWNAEAWDIVPAAP